MASHDGLRQTNKELSHKRTHKEKKQERDGRLRGGDDEMRRDGGGGSNRDGVCDRTERRGMEIRLDRERHAYLYSLIRADTRP